MSRDARPGSSSISTLNRYQRLGQAADEALRELLELAALASGVERCMVGLADEEHRWIRDVIGVDANEAPRYVPLCLYVVHVGDRVVEGDAAAHDALANLLLVKEGKVRFFAGFLLRDGDEHVIGAACFIDRRAHRASDEAVAVMARAARHIGAELLLRREIDGIRGRHLTHLEALRTLQEVEEIKDDFIANVSHELRTPLTAILGSLGLVLGGVAGDVPASVVELLAIAQENGDRLLRLVNEILDLRKMESGTFELSVAPCDLRAVVTRAVELTRPFADQHGVALATQVGVEPVVVEGDEERLVQVIVNLLANGAKFSPRGGQVRVTLERAPEWAGWARILVADNGPGIPEEFRPRVFKRFAQAWPSDGTSRGGTGLGLSVVKSIVELHAGRVGFETDKGRGTTFYVDLPLAQG